MQMFKSSSTKETRNILNSWLHAKSSNFSCTEHCEPIPILSTTVILLQCVAVLAQAVIPGNRASAVCPKSSHGCSKKSNLKVDFKVDYLDLLDPSIDS